MFFKERSTYVIITKKGGITLIKVNLDKYIEKYNLNINQLSKETGISRKALTALANYNKDENPPVSIQYNTIEILCKYFKIGVDSLITYEYDEKDFQVLPINLNAGRSKNISIFLLLYHTVVNQIEKLHYFPITVSITNDQAPEELTFEIPKPFWGELDTKKIELEKRTTLTPRFLSFQFEVVPTKYRQKLNKYFSIEPFKDFFDTDGLVSLNDEEVSSLMKSFKKSFLATITASFFDYVLDDFKVETNISVNWNFGYYSFMHASDFHFEYALHGNTITSLDDDNLTDITEPFIEINDPSVESNTFPNTFNL